MEESTQLPDWPMGDLLFRKVNRSWKMETLVGQKGWFPLADVMKTMDPENAGKYRRILNQRDKMIKAGEDAIGVMGLKQYGKRIWADMPVFSRWYAENEALWVHRIPKDWNLQTFLEQRSGTFSLNRVLQLLPGEWPIKYPAMTTMIQKASDPRKIIGADKVDGVGYVVFMPKFGEWIRQQMS